MGKSYSHKDKTCMPTVLVETNFPNEKTLIFEVENGGLLFDELERQGLLLPHGCLSGSCGACRTEVLEGALNLAPPGPVERDTLEAINSSHLNKNIRLSCRAKILGDVKIRILI